MVFRDRRWWGLMALLALAVAAPAREHAGYWNEITALVFHQDGKTVFAACLDEKLHIYDVASGKERAVINAHKEGVWAVALSPDGRAMASGGGDKAIRLWDAATFKEMRTFEGHSKEVLAVAFSPDGKTLASGAGDRTIRTWDIATGKQKQVWHGHELKVLSVAFSADGKMLASGGVCTAALPGFARGATHSDQVRLWDAETGKEIRQSTQRGTTVCFSPDGRAIAVAGAYVTGTPLDGGSTIVSRGSKATFGPILKDTPWMELKSGGGTLALSPDGRLLAAAYGTRLHVQQQGKSSVSEVYDTEHWRISLWETATGKVVKRVADEVATVIAISPDCKKLASGYASGEVKFWDLAPDGWKDSGNVRNLQPGELEKLWAELAGDAAEPAYAAIWTLAAAGKPAIAFLNEKLQPQQAVAAEQVNELLAKLDSDKYNVREAAFRDLKNLGSVIEEKLRGSAADNKTSKEVRQRLQKLLDSWERRPGSPEELRQARALQVLERLATAEARAVLTRLADGAPGAWLTEEARRAVKRVTRGG